MPYYRFVIHLLFYITMALSTDLILFEDIFYFPHFMKIFLVFFFCRYSFFSYRLVSFLLPNLLFTVFRRFFPKTCFYRLSAFFFVGLKFFLLRYIYLFLFIVEILFSKYYSFFFIIKILLEYFLWCFCISFSTDGISSLASFFFTCWNSFFCRITFLEKLQSPLVELFLWISPVLRLLSWMWKFF